MTQVVYDGSFEGLLTAVFEIYEYKFTEASIHPAPTFNAAIFGQRHNAVSDREKAKRVWKKLEAISPQTARSVHLTYLAEIPYMENLVLSFIRYVLSGRKGAERNIGNPHVLKVTQTVKKVEREKHRLEAFVRFQLTSDELYYAIIAPDFNVLPLIAPHFSNRYADQRWLIYDEKRKYGIYYDLQHTTNVTLDFNEETANGKDISHIIHETEAAFQQLWKRYFTSVNIPSRKNMQLHIRHMPKRYWRYLTEKGTG